MATPDEIDQLFAPIADAVGQFAQAQAQCVHKCVRDNAGWELTRAHPLGGEIFLLMLYDASLGLGIGSVWHFPCAEMSLLYLHFRKMRPCAWEPGAVTMMLEEELAAITQVKFGYWTDIARL